jgi:hypothetical protein
MIYFAIYQPIMSLNVELIFIVNYFSSKRYFKRISKLKENEKQNLIKS